VNTDVVDFHAVARGAAFGLLLFVPLSAIRVVVDQDVADFDHSGWAPVFAIALFVVYVLAGLVAARAAPDAPLSNGIVAAVGAFLLWIPIRILIWAIRDNAQGLFSGPGPVFTPARILGQIVFAAAFGAFGGWIASRRATGHGSVDA
jgi:hypothetical protein